MDILEFMHTYKGNGLILGGHRGHISVVRENTLLNFEEVKKIGVHYIEIDVQLTADKEVVIYHDIDLSGKTVLKGMIHDYSYEELKESFEINTLEESIQWCIDNHIYMAIEIKCNQLHMYMDMPILADKINYLLEKYNFYSSCFVFSINYDVLNKIKDQCAKVNIGLIVPFIPVNPVKLMEEMRAIVYICYIETLSPLIVEQLHNAGFKVDGSVINTQERLEKALALNVDMIESDYPQKIKKILESL